jgi:hypothetical protein
MHISFKIITFYFTLCCSTCFGQHCVHYQELLIAAHVVSGHRVMLGQLFPPAMFCCYSSGHHVVLGRLFPPALFCCYSSGHRVLMGQLFLQPCSVVTLLVTV